MNNMQIAAEIFVKLNNAGAGLNGKFIGVIERTLDECFTEHAPRLPAGIRCLGDLWGAENSMKAMAQGWDVFAVDGNQNKLQIQRLDEAEAFDSDKAALAFVVRNELMYKHCALALRIAFGE